MENSFSLQFNPLQQLKSVQDYEKEIERLMNENFQIKHELSYYKNNPSYANVNEDIQKLLLDSKLSIDVLENENKTLTKQIEHLKELIRANSQDKEKLRNDLENNKNISELRICTLEEENQRLLNHIENLKQKNEKNIQEHKLYENKLIDIEQEKNYLKNVIEEYKTSNNNLTNRKK
ncbi:hypothetical protein NAPIS_ORF00202 [Vairimorpha apis BRL 01]|uniref:Uncharacterized protein n=1 Tax=Vairimorpha apis BRL 01 TaxID=1037528 RepID=T0MGG3_9MICR|nr:hypothetical protein NAPIS_ORF00202 [Vairimorpha apis BRL 01]